MMVASAGVDLVERVPQPTLPLRHLHALVDGVGKGDVVHGYSDYGSLASTASRAPS